ncbi:MAG TPA: DUF5666 domain-containing protein [Candidatus Acidoferrales bacterium]|nr:DUF5666 domain-containing protein [Candidatus Acidoferrales bacterium]
MWRNAFFALALASCVLLVACGGPMTTPSASNGVPMSLSIGDTPPNGVAVLFFESLITGASLQPSDTMKPAVSVLSKPVEVEFGHLQTDTAFLSLANVPPDMYKSITLTFGTAAMTIVNHSGAAIGSCANNTVCELTPAFSSTTATLSTAPFPITVDDNSVIGIRLDFNLDSSVQADLSINPMVTITHLTQRDDSDEGMEMEQIDEVDGEVTTVGTNQFTLMNERSGQSFTISVDASTQFEDFDRAGCSAIPADFSCVKMGQILNVNLSEGGSGTMLAKRVEFEEDANKEAIKGTITSVDSSTQFHMVVFNEEPAVNGVSEGASVSVMIQPGAVFQVGREEMGEEGGFSFGGLSFASSSDLIVGQDVQIRPVSVTSSGGTTTIATDLVRLWPSQITGQVGNLNSDAGTFTLTGLSPLFTGAMPPITTINVVTLSGMDLTDFSGLSSLTAGNTVSVKGLLFNTPGAPTLVTRTMREDHEH